MEIDLAFLYMQSNRIYKYWTVIVEPDFLEHQDIRNHFSFFLNFLLCIEA